MRVGGIDDDTSDGGQYQNFQKTLSEARVKEAFEVGWVMRVSALRDSHSACLAAAGQAEGYGQSKAH